VTIYFLCCIHLQSFHRKVKKTCIACTTRSAFTDYCPDRFFWATRFFRTHGIAMPKGLYFCRCGFFFHLFSTPNLWDHWTDLNQTYFTYDCYLKNLVRTPPSIYPSLRAGAKEPFLGPILNFDRTNLCNWTWYQQSERNMSTYSDSPTCHPNLVTFGLETAQNGWWVFAHPLNFRIWRHCQPYRINVI